MKHLIMYVCVNKYWERDTGRERDNVDKIIDYIM